MLTVRPPILGLSLRLLLENEEDAGLVKDDSLVKDLAGLTSDPEGLDLTYEVVGASDATDFDFDGSKLMTAAAILDTIISRSPDNPNTDGSRNRC